MIWSPRKVGFVSSVNWWESGAFSNNLPPKSLTVHRSKNVEVRQLYLKDHEGEE